MADTAAGVVGAAGIGGSAAAAMAGWPWWITAPAAGIGLVSGVVALGGRTAELWRRVVRIQLGNERDRAVVAEIRRISDRLQDPALSPKERQKLLEQLGYLYRLLGDDR